MLQGILEKNFGKRQKCFYAELPNKDDVKLDLFIIDSNYLVCEIDYNTIYIEYDYNISIWENIRKLYDKVWDTLS